MVIRLQILIMALLGAAVPLTVSACEPVLPLSKLLGSSTAIGSVIYVQSAVWLYLAIALKCVAFAYFERRLPLHQAAGFMLLANVVSTIPGMLIAGFAAGGPLVIFILPIIYCLGRMVERRTRHLPSVPGRLRMTGGMATLAFILFFVLSMTLYILAYVAFEQSGFASYWIVKFFFVALVACTGLVISAILEECVIARFSRKAGGDLSFYTSVIRANYVTLGAILLVGAVAILPERLRSPGFLAAWLEQLWTSLPLG
jgi:hypothetical protein